MKKIFLALVFMLSVCCYAKTQKAVSYYSRNLIVKEINSMISQGWSVVSMTTVIKRDEFGSTTDYVIVVYEKD